MIASREVPGQYPGSRDIASPTNLVAQAMARSCRDAWHARTMDVDRLIERLLKIESLHAGATTPGEMDAAAAARARILARLARLEDEPEDFRFTLTSRWSQKLFLALARRYELKPFRRRRQHATTIMLRVKRSFLDDTFLPQFNALEAELTRHLDEVAQAIIEAAVHRDLTEVAEVEGPKQLSMAIGE